MPQRPNILFILTDQQSANMMSAAGNHYLKTPALDSLAETGVRFDRAYCTNPLCVPSRVSLMTGLYPSAFDIRDNSTRHVESVATEIRDQTLGRVLARAGYDVAYGGKVHLPKTLHPRDNGFNYISSDERGLLADACAEYIQGTHDKPWFLFASFINPHDICYMAIRDHAGTDHEQSLLDRGATELAALDWALERPVGVSEDAFFAEHCPPLPANHADQADAPEILERFRAARPFKQHAHDHWDERRWREHRYAYCRLTERMDAQVMRVLDALRASGQEEDTLVIFTSDHGDNDSAHRMEHKSVLYEEPSRVPFLVSQPGTTRAGHVDTTHLISNGLDLLPTLCDCAEIEAPEGREGMSVRLVAEGRDAQWRDTLRVESECGVGLFAARYKYVLYDEGANREQFYDLVEDPGETRNWLREPDRQEALVTLREGLNGDR